MIFSVQMHGSASKEIELEASSPEEAIALAEARCKSIPCSVVADSVSALSARIDPEDWIEVEAWDFVGRCEGCARVLLDPIPEPKGYSRTYGHDAEEGTYSCAECLGHPERDA